MKKQSKEICWNIVNSILAGLLVFGGSISDGVISSHGVVSALIASALVALVKFKDYWDGEKKEYSIHMFKFI